MNMKHTNSTHQRNQHWKALLKNAVFAGTLLSAFSLPHSILHATEVPNEEAYILDEYVVTNQFLYTDQINALRTPTPIINVPQSLSITSFEEIEKRGFDSVGDIVNYTPGVNNSQGEGHRDSVVFRGVRSTADFYIDGVRDDVQYYRPLYNVEQLEILRGPNALLFGRGGAGGILNRVTKKGNLTDSFNEYAFRLDTFGGAEARLDSNIVTSEDSAFRLNAYYETMKNHRDFYDGEAYGVNPTFKYKLGEKTTLDVSYEYLDQRRFIDRGIPTGTDNKPIDAFDGIIFGDPDLNESTLEAHIFRAMVQHAFSKELKANVTASYGDYDKFYQNFYASAYDQATTPGEVILDGYVDTTKRQNLVLSGNLIGEFETGAIEHTLLFGAEYINTSSDQDRFNPVWSIQTVPGRADLQTFDVTNPLALNGGRGVNANGNAVSVAFTDPNDDTSAELDVFSLYLQDEIKLTEQLRVVLGARFDSFEIDIEDNLNAANDGSQKDEAVTPRGGIIYKPQEAISIYASYSETFLPQSGEQYANLGDEGLDPNEFTNLEAGLKWDFSSRLSITAAIFQIQQDIVQSDGLGGSESLETEINGIETQLRGRISKDWTISAGYSYLDGELDNGNTPQELPTHMFSIWNNYQLNDKLGLGLGATYQSSSYITNTETAELPGYIRFDAAAYYQISENVRLQINIENLLDENYYPNAHSTHQVTVGAPINASFSITSRF